MAKQCDWVIGMAAAMNYAGKLFTTAIDKIEVVQNAADKYVFRCTFLDTSIPPVDLEIPNILSNEMYAWVVEHHDKLLYNAVTDQLEYDGKPIESVITEDIVATVACGAVKVGDKVKKNTSLTDFAKQLLLQELAPKVAITSNLDYANTCYERGVDISPTLTITASKVNADDSDIKNITLTSSPADATFDMVNNSPNPNTNTIVKTVTLSETTSYTAKATNMIDKVGSKTAKFIFVDPIYYGGLDETLTVDTVTEADILTGEKELINIPNEKEMTQILTINMKKIYIAYPKAFGELKGIKDVANGFELISGFEKGEIDIEMADGTVVPYYCYMGVVRSNVTDFETDFKW